MKEYNIKTYFPRKNKWKGVSITNQAITQILSLIKSHSDNKGIRLGIKKSGCAGFRYTMTLITNSELKKKKSKEEITFFYQNILIYIYSADIPFLEGVEIDFVENSINKIFKFNNPNLERFCGCGESFSIN